MEDFEVIFERKKVKNYCIRIAGDGSVRVTVPFRSTMAEAEKFVRSRADWILKKRSEMQRKIVLDPSGLRFLPADEEYFRWLAGQTYPRFSPYHIPFPALKFRVMRGRWGSCVKKKGEITLNKMCKLLPRDCQEYVIAHEMAHLVEANHGRAFYDVLAFALPDYREREEKLDHFLISRD